MSEGGPANFHVTYPGMVRQSFVDAITLAEHHGRSVEALSAMKIIDRRLHEDPLTFGEPLYYLPSLRLNVRLAGVAPLFVTFGVHAEERFLIVSRICYLENE